MVTLSSSSVGGTTTITAASSLTPPIWFHWWLNGVYQGRTNEGLLSVQPAAGETLNVECVDTTDPAYDPATFTSACAPARRRLEWVRSLDAHAAAYVLEQQANGGAWTPIATVAAAADWLYSLRSDPLDDLASYAWRVAAADAAGNRSSAETISSEMIVRTPDAPSWALAVAAGNVTFNPD